jgi:hypothetical protein
MTLQLAYPSEATRFRIIRKQPVPKISKNVNYLNHL